MSDNPSSLASPQPNPQTPPQPPPEYGTPQHGPPNPPPLYGPPQQEVSPGRAGSRPTWTKGQAGHRRKPRQVLPPANIGLLVLLLGSAFAFELATQSSVASVAGWLAIAGCSAAIGYRKWEAGILSRSSLTSLTLAIAAGFNLILRSALVVTIPTWLLVLSLLTWGATDVTSRSVSEQLRSTVRLVEDAFTVPSWLLSSAERSTSRGHSPTSFLPVLRGIALTILVAGPVLLLLASGDKAFGTLLTAPSFDLGSIFGHAALSGLFLLPIAALSLTAGRLESEKSEGPKAEGSKVAGAKDFPLEAMIVLAGLVASLGLWCGVQVTVRAGGAEGIFFNNSDVTRADYAREGFFQLVAVACIVVAVLAFCGIIFRSSTGKRSNIARVSGLVLAAETVALTGVAFSRLDLYTQAYGLTSTRLAVAWFLAWLGLVLLVYVGRIALGFPGLGYPSLTAALHSRFATPTRLLPVVRSLLCAIVILYGLSNPDLTVATNNLGRDESLVKLDRWYLFSLSSDATPAIFAEGDRFEGFGKEYPQYRADSWSAEDPELRIGVAFNAFETYCIKKQNQQIEYGWLGWNYATATARNLAEDYDCVSEDA